MAAEQRRPPGEHPDPETLLAYHERALPEAEADRVQEHLVQCSECAQAVLDFAAFPELEPPAEEYRLTRDELGRRWHDLQASLTQSASPWWQHHQVLLPLAAAFFVAVVGLGLWASHLRGRIAELEGPRGDVQFLAYLSPTTEVTRGGTEAVQLRADASQVVIHLNLATGEEYPRYRLRIERGPGEAVAPDEELVRSPDGVFTVLLSSELLRPGRYRLELLGENRGRSTLLAVYELVVES